MTPEASPARRALTAVILAAALFAAVVVQLTVVNRLPLPGPLPGSMPPRTWSCCWSPRSRSAPRRRPPRVTGFAGGLALDIAPPAAHYAGEYALVFCLAGYAAARVVQVIRNATGERDPVTAFTVMAVAAAAGEAGKAALGMLLSDPDVTAAAVSRVLPAAVLYDLLLAPLGVLAGHPPDPGRTAERAAAPDLGLGLPRPRARAAPAPAAGPRLGAPRSGGPRSQVFRQASAGAAPGLRLAGTGGNYAARRRPAGSRDCGSPARQELREPAAGRVPKLRLSGARSASSLRTRAAATPGRPPAPGGRPGAEAELRGEPPARPSPGRAARTPGKNWLGAAVSPALPAAKRAGPLPVPRLAHLGGRRRPGGRARGYRIAGPGPCARLAPRCLVKGSPRCAASPARFRWPWPPGGRRRQASPPARRRLACRRCPARARRWPAAARRGPAGSASRAGRPRCAAGRRAPRAAGSAARGRPRPSSARGVPGHGGPFRRGRGGAAAGGPGQLVHRLPVGRVAAAQPPPVAQATSPPGGTAPRLPRAGTASRTSGGAGDGEGRRRAARAQAGLFGLTGGRR